MGRQTGGLERRQPESRGCYSELESMAPEGIRAHQLARLNHLLSTILPTNRFYARKFGKLSLPLRWDAFRQLPFTTKAELVADQLDSAPLGTIATYGPDSYSTYHQTSGTTGRPIVILDTQESWNWWIQCWQYVYRSAGVDSRDRLFFAFSFGPFIGFWSAYAAAQHLGALTIPGGAMDSKQRLQLILASEATVLLCTPTYALHLAEVAQREGLNIRDSAVRITIHAGEPGASLPSVRQRVEAAWGARCYDHAGATEVGAYGYACAQQSGLHINEAEFIAEVLDPHTSVPVEAGQIGELVITNLGRFGWPVIRYRTGDLVRVGGHSCPCGRTFLSLPGGLIGRADDMIVVRGVNIYPSAIEAVVRTFEVGEFQIIRHRRNAMEELLIKVETSDATAAQLADTLRQRFNIRIPTQAVAAGSLPRWELKARRILDQRHNDEPATATRLS